jgi:acylphosphatase
MESVIDAAHDWELPRLTSRLCGAGCPAAGAAPPQGTRRNLIERERHPPGDDPGPRSRRRLRAWTEYAAEARGLHGWVRNRRDGSVEALFAGSADEVRAMIDDCRQGPPGSRVDAIEEREGSADELMLRSGYRFATLPTA